MPIEGKDKFCGFIMPISGKGKYPVDHWTKIKNILTDIAQAATKKLKLAGEEPEVVSIDFANPDIKSVIFNNLFSIPIVICDVSGNNPNVIYELGLRVAFDMPVIIIKDKDTEFSFDINSLLTIEYPNNLTQLGPTDPNYKEFSSKLFSRIIYTYYEFAAGSVSVSPLAKYLHHEHYLQIKRGVPFDLAGHYEYICYREELGYSHGGKCEITLKHFRGSIIEWQLKGARHWKKDGTEYPVQEFMDPYRWETKKAILFEDKQYLVSYEIRTPADLIIGIIQGYIELEQSANRVKKFDGYYYQEGKDGLVKGRFKMLRRPQSGDEMPFQFKPGK
jgi:hypothetical protein